MARFVAVVLYALAAIALLNVIAALAMGGDVFEIGAWGWVIALVNGAIFAAIAWACYRGGRRLWNKPRRVPGTRGAREK